MNRTYEDLVRLLAAELEEARWNMLDLMPDGMRQLLKSFRDCESPAAARGWLERIAGDLIASAEPLKRTTESSAPARARCPLCRGGTQSRSPQDEGYSLPEGLRRHLIGFSNVRQCVVTTAALQLAEAHWRREFTLRDAAG